MAPSSPSPTSPTADDSPSAPANGHQGANKPVKRTSLVTVEPERVATLLLGAARAFDAAPARVARVEGGLKALARTTDARAWHVLQIVGVGLKQHRGTLAKDKTQLIQPEVLAAVKRTLGLPLPPEPASPSGDAAAGSGEGEKKDAAGGRAA